MLKYIGSGFLPGVPARDLSDGEVEQYGGADALIASGLYEVPRRIEIKVEARPSKPVHVRTDVPQEPKDGVSDE